MPFPLGTARVAGDSMRPYLYDGDWVVIRRGRPGKHGPRARVGDVVVVRRPDRPELVVVKRVGDVRADGRLWLIGDNPAASDDSRVFGAVPPAAVEGRVVWRYKPLRRT